MAAWEPPSGICLHVRVSTCLNLLGLLLILIMLFALKERGGELKVVLPLIWGENDVKFVLLLPQQLSVLHQ